MKQRFRTALLVISAAVCLALLLIRTYGSAQFVMATLTSYKQPYSATAAQHALVVKVPREAQVVIVGNLQGHPQGLAALEAGLTSHGLMLDGNLADDTYLIFNGNIFSAYGDQGALLERVLELLERYPDRVWFVQGKHDLKIQRLFGQELGYKELMQVQRFVAQAPVGIYLLQGGQGDKPILITPVYDPQEFETISCTPLEHGATKAVCELGVRCSYEQGELRGCVTSAPQGDTVDGTCSQISSYNGPNEPFQYGLLSAQTAHKLRIVPVP